MPQTPDPTDLTISRRAMLALMGSAAAAAFLAGCEANNPGHAVMPEGSLPDPRMLPRPDALIPDPEVYAPTQPVTPPPVRQVLPPPPNTLGIIPRAYWAREGPAARITRKPMDGVRLITFHHSGDPKVFTGTSFAETAAHLEGVRYYHKDQKGWEDIGYHFAIDRAGRIWQLRSLRYEGQHVRYHNEHNIGVVILGNFNLQSMTQAQLSRAKYFAKLLMAQYRVPLNCVKTHQEIVKTDCPGRNMQGYFAAARRQAFA